MLVYAILALWAVFMLVKASRSVRAKKEPVDLSKEGERDERDVLKAMGEMHTLDLKQEALRSKITDLYEPYGVDDSDKVRGRWIRLKGSGEEVQVTHLSHRTQPDERGDMLLINGTSAFDLLLLAEHLDGSVFGKIKSAGGDVGDLPPLNWVERQKLNERLTFKK